MFSTKINKRLIKFTELGGGEEFYDIWKYYFLDVSERNEFPPRKSGKAHLHNRPAIKQNKSLKFRST